MVDQLQDAIAAIKAGDKGKGKRLLSILVQAEPQNAEAWSLLAEVLDDPQQILFCRQRAQSIASTKLSHPIKPSEPASTVASQPPAPRLKKCLYCAEEIQPEAIICKHCGRDLTKKLPEEIIQRRDQLAQRLAEHEKNLARWERYLQEQKDIVQQAGRQVTWAIIGIIIGLFLIPIYIGLIIVPAGILAAITQGLRRSGAEKNQSKARQNIESIQKHIIDVKSQLTKLQWT